MIRRASAASSTPSLPTASHPHAEGCSYCVSRERETVAFTCVIGWSAFDA
jgi:hypothetical protein